jgi:hypothetical protein
MHLMGRQVVFKIPVLNQIVSIAVHLRSVGDVCRGIIGMVHSVFQVLVFYVKKVLLVSCLQTVSTHAHRACSTAKTLQSLPLCAYLIRLRWTLQGNKLSSYIIMHIATWKTLTPWHLKISSVAAWPSKQAASTHTHFPPHPPYISAH